MPSLFDPITLGSIECKNRILMAPLTRGRGTHTHIPNDLMVEYYRQRVHAGLIFTEATGISQQGLGTPYAPGIWTPEQMDGWRKVTRAVHHEGGKIVLQLWHMGRVVHSSFLSGEKPVSASATTSPGHAHVYHGKEEYDTARALSVEEIAGIVHQYGVCARNAMDCGFDGVQVHGANGYLIDQFLREYSNFRKDEYGGSIDNRIRFLTEVVTEVVDAVGAAQVGVRLSPNGEILGVNDTDPIPLFTAAAQRLNDIGIAYLEVREAAPGADMLQSDSPQVHPSMREVFHNPFIINGSFDYASGMEALSNGDADAVSYGRPFISNPNLPKVFKEGKKPAEDDMKTWYSRGPKGYTDYPEL
ncbi:alkene reductase [Sphingomonas sp. CLY1604]|uniref:alkene reductase n=1 Tax=Sphingomonas sp. CLY1604 TaxID=3457786 RepID=UPI003FD6EFC7